MDNTDDAFDSLRSRIDLRQEQLDADTRTAEQIAADIGALFDTAMNAIWNNASEADIKSACVAFAEAMAHPSSERLMIHAAAVDTGDYVRASGIDEYGLRTHVSGVVEEIDYEEREYDELGHGAVTDGYGFTFAIRPVIAAGLPERPQCLVWVYDAGYPTVLRLPKPTHRTN